MPKYQVEVVMLRLKGVTLEVEAPDEDHAIAEALQGRGEIVEESNETDWEVDWASDPVLVGGE